MDEILRAASHLWKMMNQGDHLRLLGGLAVRLHVGEEARNTRDIDVVAMDEPSREHLLDQLEGAGYVVGASGGWWRASRPDDRLIVDVAQHPVVNPRTFETVCLRADAKTFLVDGTEISVAGVDDLVLLKLLAFRDQDLVDLLLLASTAEISVTAVVGSVEADDVERRASEGANRARHALRTGALEELVEESLDRRPRECELSKLQDLLASLERSGL